MGIRGLYSYISNPENKIAEKHVSILEMAKSHQTKCSAKPILVIDGNAILGSIYYKFGKLKWIHGGQWIEYKQVLEEFIRKFEDIELVFFFDGFLAPEKYDAWTERKIQQCGKRSGWFNLLKDGKALPPEASSELPTSLSILTSMAIKALFPDMKVFCTLSDADNVIAHYAHENDDVFGILSNDSDFIIFDTKPYFRIDDLNYENMTTTVYYRERLLKVLNLSSQDLPLLSCLLGNDWILKDELINWHKTLRFQMKNKKREEFLKRNDLFTNVADFIRNLKCTDLTVISKKIWGNGTLSKKLSLGIDMYIKSHHRIPCGDCKVEELHYDCKNHASILNVYKHCFYKTEVAFGDCMDIPNSEIYQPIRLRCYSIICKGIMIENSPVSHIEERCVHLKMKTEMVELENIENFANMNCLQDLWEEQSRTTKKNRSVKWKYFFACLQIKLTESEMNKIDSKFVVLCCLINYLCEKGQLEKLSLEVKAFIVQAVYIYNKIYGEIRDFKIQGCNKRKFGYEPQSSKRQKNSSGSYTSLFEDPTSDNEDDKTLFADHEAVRLCTLFMQGVSTMIMLLGVCGYPISAEDAMPWNYFDGKIFHEMYKSLNNNKSVKNLLKQKDMKLYNELYKMATYGI